MEESTRAKVPSRGEKAEGSSGVGAMGAGGELGRQGRKMGGKTQADGALGREEGEGESPTEVGDEGGEAAPTRGAEGGRDKAGREREEGQVEWAGGGG